MAKTQEELTQLKTELEALINKLNELSDEELKQVTGGADFSSKFSPSIVLSDI